MGTYRGGFVRNERQKEGVYNCIYTISDFGSFRMVAGSKGATTEEEFKTSLFNRAHIVFYPGTMLMNLVRDASFEKWTIPGSVTTPSEGEDDRPVIE